MCCKWLSKDDRGALHGSNAEGERDWESSRVRKDTKVYQAVSSGIERVDEGVRSRFGYALVASFLMFV